jgi:hypothetical protein
MPIRSHIPVSDAARELGVEEARVRALIAAGELAGEKIGGRWLVDAASVAARREAPAPGGRPFAPSNAWIVLRLASGAEPGEAVPQVVSRLRRSLRLEGLEGLAPRLRRRAHASWWRAHPGELSYLRSDPRLLATGISASGELGLELAGGAEADAYVREGALQKVVREHALSPASPGEANVTLRVVPDLAADLISQAPLPAAAALDLAESPDPRSARVGKRLIAELDAELRRSGALGTLSRWS